MLNGGEKNKKNKKERIGLLTHFLLLIFIWE